MPPRPSSRSILYLSSKVFPIIRAPVIIVDTHARTNADEYSLYINVPPTLSLHARGQIEKVLLLCESALHQLTIATIVCSGLRIVSTSFTFIGIARAENKLVSLMQHLASNNTL